MFFVTVPHGGETIPSHLAHRINPHANLRAMAEPGIDRLCTWEDVDLLHNPVHLCVANLNRSRNDVDPRSGMLYASSLRQELLHDFNGTPLYHPDCEPTSQEREALLMQHYDPFFVEIDRRVASGQYRFFVDVHAMNCDSTSYSSKADCLKDRPQICLGNNGAVDGGPHADGAPITFPADALRRMAASLTAAGYSCRMNDPFRGGYIIQRYGPRIPCVQIEIRKDVFMESDDGELLLQRMDTLNRHLFVALAEAEEALVSGLLA